MRLARFWRSCRQKEPSSSDINGLRCSIRFPSNAPFALSSRCPLSLEAFPIEPFASDVAGYFWVSAWGSCIRPTAFPISARLPVFPTNDIAQMCFRSLLTADSGKNRVLGRSGNRAAHFLSGPAFPGVARRCDLKLLRASDHRSVVKGIKPIDSAGVLGKAVYPGRLTLRLVSS
jgi:hypothetical protein